MAGDRAQTFSLVVADIYELAGLLRRHGDLMAQALGQSQARWQVLSVAAEDGWTVPRIAERLGITRQAVQRVVDDLAGDGQVELLDNPAHQRSPVVALTSTGRRTLAAITASAHSWHLEVTAGVSAAQLDRVHREVGDLLGRVRDVEPS
jgi:DNA-binding MarR family transcriptional regulator